MPVYLIGGPCAVRPTQAGEGDAPSRSGVVALGGCVGYLWRVPAEALMLSEIDRLRWLNMMVQAYPLTVTVNSSPTGL